MWIRSLLAAALVLVAVPAVRAQSPHPCRDAGRYAELDFWTGEWRIVDRDGATVGTSRVEREQAGCLIDESWTLARGGGGRAMTYLDPATGLWALHGVDQEGSIVKYSGRVEDGALRFEGQRITADGSIVPERTRLEPVSDGRLRVVIERSDDQGRTWSVDFEGTYLPLGDQLVAAGAASPPEPASPNVAGTPAPQSQPSKPLMGSEPEAESSSPAARSETAETEPAQDAAPPQAGGDSREVKAVSRALEREEIPAEQVPELRMASPMVLEVVPGPVDRLPENTAWQTDETKGFMCNETIVKKVLMSRRGRGEEVEIEVGVQLYTPKRSRRAELELELLSNGRVVASSGVSPIRLGLNIPAHGKDGLMVSSEMTLTRDEFERLFAEGSSRTLRITLTVP